MEWWKSIRPAGDNLILREHDKGRTEPLLAGHQRRRIPLPLHRAGLPGELRDRTAATMTTRSTRTRARPNQALPTRRANCAQRQPKGEWYLPHCIEPAAGWTAARSRSSARRTPGREPPRPEFLKIHPRLAPIKAAVFPLVNKDGMPRSRRRSTTPCGLFQRTGSLSSTRSSRSEKPPRAWTRRVPVLLHRRRRHAQDQTVTVRDRDTRSQQRIASEKS